MSSPKRRVCIFAGSRADYGPLSSLIRRLRDDSQVELRLLVSGGHLVPDQGLSVEQIEADGLDVAECVDMVLASDSASAVEKSFGLGVLGYADGLDRIDPDLLVVFGDRYEALAVAIPAMLRLLPTAHIAGGQITEGALDDSIRHALTKLCHIHFTSTTEFRRRIIQMGECPDHVHTVGALGLDTLLSTPLLARPQLERELGMRLHPPVLVVTYHPATTDPVRSAQGLDGLGQALQLFPDATTVVTGTNVDAGGRAIARKLAQFASEDCSRRAFRPSLGQQQYLSLVKHADAVIGDSSSGLVEAPALQTPTVNVGSRQDGRPRARSVIDSGESTASIASAIQKALSPSFRAVASSATSPYGDGRAAERIAAVIRAAVIRAVTPSELLQKRFVDLEREAV